MPRSWCLLARTWACTSPPPSASCCCWSWRPRRASGACTSASGTDASAPPALHHTQAACRWFCGCMHYSRQMPPQLCCVLAITRYEKVGSEGYHSLFRWYSAFEAAQFPDPSGLRARLSAWTLGETLVCCQLFYNALVHSGVVSHGCITTYQLVSQSAWRSTLCCAVAQVRTRRWCGLRWRPSTSWRPSRWRARRRAAAGRPSRASRSVWRKPLIHNLCRPLNTSLCAELPVWSAPQYWAPAAGA